MGFGTLFAGYFLILNVTYYGFSDFLAAALMLYALYKLSFVNKSFKIAMYSICAFGAFAIFELVIFALDMLSLGGDFSTLLTVIATVRHTMICAFTVPMLMGMRDVANEVELNELGKKCQNTLLPTFIIYALAILLEAEGLFPFIPSKYLALCGLFVMLATLVLVIINLTSIYSCYMRICMPSEAAGRSGKKKAPGLLDRMMERQEQKQREYLEYKAEKIRAKQDKADKNKR